MNIDLTQQWPAVGLAGLFALATVVVFLGIFVGILVEAIRRHMQAKFVRKQAEAWYGMHLRHREVETLLEHGRVPLDPTHQVRYDQEHHQLTRVVV